MNASLPRQGQVKESPDTNKLTIILEITAVFLPFFLGILISDRLAVDRIPLFGDLVLLGGPAIYLGLVISLAVLWGVSSRRGVGWSAFGLTRPPRWYLMIFISLGVALAVLGTVVLIVNPIFNALPNLPPQDLSRFDYLKGDLPNLILQLVVVWITAGFLEEFLFRGYLMNRLVDLQGRETKLAWGVALLGQAVIFGVAHAYQSPAGMFKVGLIGLVFGLAFLVVRRNLWPLIIAHALIDSLDMITHYFGG